MATLGKDRWAGYEPKDGTRNAIITTVPLSLGGKVLVTADIGSEGSISASLIGSDDETIASSKPLSRDCTDHALIWDREIDPVNREGVRIRFKLDRAKLYAFSLK